MTHAIDFVLSKFSAANLITLGLLWVSVIGVAIANYFYCGMPRTWRGFWHFLLPPGTLSHPSAKADILFFISRKFVNVILVAPMALSAIGIGTALNSALSAILPLHPAPEGPISTWVLLLFTVTMFLGYDFSYYIYHNAQHRVPIFWELHKVHHSAEVMVGVTKDRIHPIDDFINRIWDGFVVGVIYGLWLFVAYNPVELTVVGVNVYALRQILMMDFVRHTHLKVSFGRFWNNVVICPHYHQLHHSIAPQHWDKNFGLMFAFWDRLFGTMMAPEPEEEFEFGLTDNEHREYRSWLKLYTVPIVKIYRIGVDWFAITKKARS